MLILHKNSLEDSEMSQKLKGIKRSLIEEKINVAKEDDDAHTYVCTVSEPVHGKSRFYIKRNYLHQCSQDGKFITFRKVIFFSSFTPIFVFCFFCFFFVVFF